MSEVIDRVAPRKLQADLFLPRFHRFIDERAEQFKLELAIMTRRALEEIDRGIAFHHRSEAQKRRFARYRQLLESTK